MADDRRENDARSKRRAEREMMRPTLLTAAVNAYITLLQLPILQRIHMQAELCALRDAIADATGKDAEAVQTEYESLTSRHGVLCVMEDVRTDG